MPLLFKGVRAGTHWHTNDATKTGFTAWASTMPHDLDMMMLHISEATVYSPYISLTVSYAVACSYAGSAATGSAAPTSPGYVYMVRVPDPLPSDLTLYDPVKEIGTRTPTPPAHIPYQHEGMPEYIFGVIDPRNFSGNLLAYRLGSGGKVMAQPHIPSQHLKTLVCALRDAELLVLKEIPAGYVLHRITVP
jgi:hypothetical protein